MDSATGGIIPIDERFRAALAEAVGPHDPDGPDDPPPAGGVRLDRPPPPAAHLRAGYRVYAVRLVVEGGEEQVAAGVALTGPFHRLRSAVSLCDGYALTPPADVTGATHLVVNDEYGTECHRRPVLAAA